MKINLIYSQTRSMTRNAPTDLVETGLDAVDRGELAFLGYPLTQLSLDLFKKPNRDFLGAERVLLPPNPSRKIADCSLLDALDARESSLEFSADGAVSVEELAGILRFGCGESDKQRYGHRRRFYPSGGALYPLSCYLLARKVGGIHPGIYAYEASSHSLRRIEDCGISFDEYFHAQEATPHMFQAQLAMVLVASLSNAYFKYGERAWKLALIEAGHMSQNIYLACAASGLKVNALGGFSDRTLRKRLLLDRHTERVVYPLLLGR